MVRVGIADLKAQLSRYVNVARAGEEVLITDRGRPVAMLSPLHERATEIPDHLLEMERRGEVRIGSGRIPEPAGQSPRPRRGHSAVQSLIEERREGR